MNIQRDQIDEIKIYSLTKYVIRFKLHAERATGLVKVVAHENGSSIRDSKVECKSVSTSVVFSVDSMEKNETIDVKFDYYTKFNVQYMYFEAKLVDDAGSVRISTIQFEVVKEFKDYERLSKREPWHGPKTDYKRNEIDWQALLEDDHTYYQPGNMLYEHTGIEHAPAISDLPIYPGIQNVVFFPSSNTDLKSISFVEGGIVADVAKLRFFDGACEIPLKRDWVKWYPHKMELCFSGDCIKVIQTSTISREDQIVCKLEITSDRAIHVQSSCNFNGNCAGAIDVFSYQDKSYVLAQNGLRVYLAFSSSIATSKDQFTVNNEPLEYIVDFPINKKIVYLTAAVGMEKELVETRLQQALDHPEKIFEERLQWWDDYFTKTVPAFHSDNVSLKRLYYMYNYEHIANCYDVYYEPYMYPYVCPNKTVWKPQWPWNTTWGMMSERWLNDTYLSEGGIRNELITDSFLGYMNELQPLNEYIKDSVFVSGNFSRGSSGVAFYPLIDLVKRNGDKNLLKKAYYLLKEVEDHLTSEDEDGDGLPEYWGNIDEYDQSVRWLDLYVDLKEANIKEEDYRINVENQVQNLFFHTKAVLTDYSTYLVIVRKYLAEISDYYGFHDMAKLYREKEKTVARAINEKLWSEEEGFYFDYSLKRKEMNIRWMISGVFPLMGHVASKEQANRVVENLTDTTATVVWEGTEYKAGKFCWNLYPPCTASVLNKYWRPDEVYGFGLGQTILTGGARYTLEALLNYGFYEKARYLINKLFEMQTSVNDNSLHLPYTYNSITGKGGRFHMAQQTAIFNDIILTYVVGIKLRMDNKFEFMPFDVIKDFGAMHFGPFYTKTYPMEVDWDGYLYSVTINNETYAFPYLTKWVIPVHELENQGKNKLSFCVQIESDCNDVAIFEIKATVHDDEYCFLRLPVENGFTEEFTLEVNELKGYESVVDFSVFSKDEKHYSASVTDIHLVSGTNPVAYNISECPVERVQDPVQPCLTGKIMQRICINDGRIML